MYKDKQREYLTFIVAFKNNYNIDPEVSDFVKAGLGSKQSVYQMLMRLELKHLIKTIYVNEKKRGYRRV